MVAVTRQEIGKTKVSPPEKIKFVARMEIGSRAEKNDTMALSKVRTQNYERFDYTNRFL